MLRLDCNDSEGKCYPNFKFRNQVTLNFAQKTITSKFFIQNQRINKFVWVQTVLQACPTRKKKWSRSRVLLVRFPCARNSKCIRIDEGRLPSVRTIFILLHACQTAHWPTLTRFSHWRPTLLSSHTFPRPIFALLGTICRAIWSSLTNLICPFDTFACCPITGFRNRCSQSPSICFGSL